MEAESNKSLYHVMNGTYTPTGNYNTRFVRHANSCNNANAGKRFGKDMEPGLTVEGITNTIALANNNTNFNSNSIFVSCLYRTWCTAVLLYGQSTAPLHLYISPFLKEKHTFLGIGPLKKEIQRGNHPKPFSHMVVKFKTFLDHIASDKVVFENLPPSIRLTVYPVDWETDQEEKGGVVTVTYTKQSDNTYTLYEPGTECEVKTKVQIENVPFLGEREDIDTTLVPTTSPNYIGYQEDGNLKKFMNWFDYHMSKKSNFYGADSPDIPNPVHVVSHSNLMQGYLEELGFAKGSDKVVNVHNTNCSIINTSTITKKEADKIVGLLEVIPGYPKGKGKGGEVCGTTGSVEPLEPCDVSEKKTFKDRAKAMFKNPFSRKSQEEVVVPTNGGKRTTRRGKRGKKTQKKRKRKRNKRKTASKK